MKKKTPSTVPTNRQRQKQILLLALASLCAIAAITGLVLLLQDMYPSNV